MARNQTKILVNRLLRKYDLSKWNLAKRIDVSWNTVNLWSRGVYQADENHFQKLKKLETTAGKDQQD